MKKRQLRVFISFLLVFTMVITNFGMMLENTINAHEQDDEMVTEHVYDVGKKYNENLTVPQKVYLENEDILNKKIQDQLSEFKKYYKTKASLDFRSAMAYYYSSDHIKEDLEEIKNKFSISSYSSNNIEINYKGMIGAIASEKNPRDFEMSNGKKVNFVEALALLQDENGNFMIKNAKYVSDKAIPQAYSMIALDMAYGNYDVEKAVEVLLNDMKDEKDISYVEGRSPADRLYATSKAMIALSNHKDIDGVNEKLSRCIKYVQQTYPKFETYIGEEETASIIQGLIAVGEDLTSNEYKNIIDKLLNSKDYKEESFAALTDLNKHHCMYHVLKTEKGQVATDIIAKTSKDEINEGECLKVFVDIVDNEQRPVLGKNINFKSNNQEVLKVDEKGVVTALGEGIGTIKVSCEGLEKSINIRVKSERDIFKEEMNKITYFDNQTKYNFIEALTLRQAGVKKSIIKDKININKTPTTPEEYAENIISILSAGEDPNNYEGIDYVKDLVTLQNEDGTFGSNKGIQNIVLPVLALDMAKAKYNADSATNAIGNSRNRGIYTYFKGNAVWDTNSEVNGYNDIEMTALAIIAMSNHKENPLVENVIKNCFRYIRVKQTEKGAINYPFVYYQNGKQKEKDKENCKATALAIQAVIAVGKNPLSDEWKKGDHTLYDGLKIFRVENGFKRADYFKTKGKDQKATIAGLGALVSLYKNKSIFNPIEDKEEIISKPSKINIIIDQKIIKEGDQTTLTAKVLDQEGNELKGQKIKWTSSDTNIAQIDTNGKLTTNEVDKDQVVTITGQVVGTSIEDKVHIKVTNVVPNKLVIVKPSSIQIGINDVLNLKANVYDSYGNMIKNINILWTSNDENVAKVENGVVTGINHGETTICAKIENTDIKDTIKINVIGDSVEKIDILSELEEKLKEDIDNEIVRVDDEMILQAKGFNSLNQEIGNQDVVWSSSDEKVLSIDQNTGKVKGISKGRAVITAILKENKSIKATQVVEVIDSKKSITVNVRIEGYNKTIVEDKNITIDNFDLRVYSARSSYDQYGPDHIKNILPVHAIIKTLETEGYNCKDKNVLDVSGLYLYKILEDMQGHIENGEVVPDTSGWMYSVNDIVPDQGMNVYELKDGDDIIFFYVPYFLDNGTGFMTKLTSDRKNVKKGEEVKFLLQVLDGDIGKNPNLNPVNEASILINGVEKGKTNKNGEFIYRFDEDGEYVISAKRDGTDIDKNIYKYIVKPKAISINVGELSEEIVNKDTTPPQIYTDLKDQRVTNPVCTFKVEVKDLVDQEIIPIVKVNDQEIKENNKTYTANLKEGDNKIVIYAVDKACNKIEKTINITYSKKSKFATKVIEYMPAPGQFINDELYGTQNAAKETLFGKNGFVSLGGFGGYIVYGFDNRIENNKNAMDFKVYGNAFEGNKEPAGVAVMKDENGNGLADDKWYYLAGSEYNAKDTIKDYSVTYKNLEDKKGVLWSDNKGKSGIIKYNGYHKQKYYPTPENFPYIDQNQYTLSGILINNRDPKWGYADVSPNGDEMDIDWAVDEEGKFVKLDGIDFVKIYTAVQMDAGIFGEVSSEIGGVEDLDEGSSTNYGKSDAATPPINKKSIKSYIRIEGNKETILGKTAIYLDEQILDLSSYGVNKKYKDYMVAHPTLKALQDYNIRYDLQDNYMAMIGGLRERSMDSSKDGWMYYIDHEYKNVGLNECPIKDKDYIVWFYTEDYKKGHYAWFDQEEIKAQTGEELTLTLKGRSTNLNGDTKTIKNIEKASIIINNEKYKLNGEVVKTDKDGKAILKFNQAGTYYISAERFNGDIRDISRPYCNIVVQGSTVSGDGEANSIKVEKDKDSKIEKYNVVLELPKGSVDENTYIKIEKKDNVSSLKLKDTEKIIGSVYEITKDNKKDFKKAITITLPFEKSRIDKNKEKISICYYDESNKKWVDLDNIKVDFEKGKVSGEVNHFTKFAVITKKIEEEVIKEPVNKETKVDLKDIIGHWAEGFIKELVQKQAISGYPDQTFKPDKNITRAEFAAVVIKAFKLQDKEGKVFIDTKDHWAKDIISTAFAHGIVSGYEDGTFRPDEKITREQMAVMVVKASKLTNQENTQVFADHKDISSWAKEAIDIVVSKEIIKGYPDKTLKPQGNATRAEAVTVIVKAMK